MTNEKWYNLLVKNNQKESGFLDSHEFILKNFYSNHPNIQPELSNIDFPNLKRLINFYRYSLPRTGTGEENLNKEIAKTSAHNALTEKYTPVEKLLLILIEYEIPDKAALDLKEDEAFSATFCAKLIKAALQIEQCMQRIHQNPKEKSFFGQELKLTLSQRQQLFYLLIKTNLNIEHINSITELASIIPSLEKTATDSFTPEIRWYINLLNNNKSENDFLQQYEFILKNFYSNHPNIQPELSNLDFPSLKRLIIFYRYSLPRTGTGEEKLNREISKLLPSDVQIEKYTPVEKILLILLEYQIPDKSALQLREDEYFLPQFCIMLIITDYKIQQFFNGFEWGLLFFGDKAMLKRQLFNKLILIQILPSAKTLEALDIYLAPEENSQKLLANLMPLSNLSIAQKNKMINFFNLFPFVKAFILNYADALSYEGIANSLFKTIKNPEDKNILVNAHFRNNEPLQALLSKLIGVININPLHTYNIPDFAIILMHYYQADELLKDIEVENNDAIMQMCHKLLKAAHDAQKYLDADFHHKINQSWFVTDVDKRNAMAIARKQAIILAYHDPEVLHNIACNSQALTDAYQYFVQTPGFNLSLEELERLRDDHISPDDSISNIIAPSQHTNTTALALYYNRRDGANTAKNALNYNKMIVHTTRNRTAEEQKYINQLRQEVHSNITSLFTGILSIASNIVSRATCTNTDKVLDAMSILMNLLPDPITRLVTLGLLKTGQFFQDYSEKQNFSNMAKHLELFEKIDQLNTELTTKVLEDVADQFFICLNASTNKEKCYINISAHVIDTLIISILDQLKTKVISNGTTQIGELLFQNFKAMPLDLNAVAGNYKILSF